MFVATAVEAQVPTGGVALSSIRPDAFTGAATFAIPIAVPPAREELTPRLELDYSSDAANGLVGVGWSLDGLSAIYRCHATISMDGFRGGVNYDGNDRFCLDDERLMAISGRYGASETEYRTRRDIQRKVLSLGVAGAGPASFKVWAKSGTVFEYGGTADARIELVGQPSVRVWALNRVQDPSGNYLQITYREDQSLGEYYPLRMDYVGHEPSGLAPPNAVRFVYEPRPDPGLHVEFGAQLRSTVRLARVMTYTGCPAPTAGTEDYSGCTLVRDYRLAYDAAGDMRRSRLLSVTPCAANGQCLPPVEFAWQKSGIGFSPVYSPHTGRDWSFGRRVYSPQMGTDWASSKLARPLAGDFNGDGKTDLAISAWRLGGVGVYLSNGDGTFTPVYSAQPGADWVSWENAKPLAGDFNGDGQTDLAVTAEGLGGVGVYLSKGDGTFTPVYSSGTENNWVSRPDAAQAGDFNGDGKTDLIATAGPGSVGVYLSNGDGTFTPVYSSQASFGRLGDFNGDGKTDIARWEMFDVFSDLASQVYLSNGDGTFMLHTPVWPRQPDPLSWDPCRMVGDFNGDGKADIATAFRNTSRIPVLLGGVGVNVSNGDGTFTLVYSTPVDPSLRGGCTKFRPTVGDFNGDGKADIAISADGFGGIATYLSSGPATDLLVGVSNGVGGTAVLSYTPSTAQAGNTLPAVVWTLTQVTLGDGLGWTATTRYAYAGAGWVTTDGGEFRGFAQVTVTDPSGAQTFTIFHQDEIKQGQVREVWQYDAAGAALTSVRHTVVDAAPFPGVLWARLDRTDTEVYDGGGRQTAVSYEYDIHGNPTRVYHWGDLAIAGDERDERTDWLVDASAWLHRPSRTSLHDAAGVVVWERWRSYDELPWGALGARGLLTREEPRLAGPPGTPGNPVLTYGYDAYGNRTVSVSPRGCAASTTYESSQTYPASVTTCLGHTTRFAWDPRWGTKTSETDPNGQTTTFSHDGFGRLTRVTGPLDTGSLHGSVSHEYLDWGDPARQRIRTVGTEHHGTANARWSEQYFDGLGRIDRELAEGPGGQAIEINVALEARGLVAAKTAPHFATEDPASSDIWTRFTYDALGRMAEVRHPDGTVVRTAYAPGLVTLTNERGNVTRKFSDAYGRMTRVEEVNGNETYATTYTHDAAGRLTRVTNHLGHSTTMTYDLLGRKVAMSDPNTGSWTYTYDLDGNLVGQTDARGQTLSLGYDVQGRLRTKAYPDGRRIVWIYDDPGVAFSRGRLTNVRDLAGVTEFTYDALGRVTQTQRLLDGTTYTLAQNYDAVGRVVSQTFPDGEAVSYAYNEAGWLASIAGYVTNITYNARGERTRVQYDNGVTTIFDYDPTRFRLTNRTTSGPSGALQNLSYTYDPLGNMTEIADEGGTGSRTFTYDALNRLVSASGAFGPAGGGMPVGVTESYRYDAIGNLLEKAGILYTYGDAAHPSAVTDTSDGRVYTYDPNGNVLSGAGRSMTWDTDNRLVGVTVEGDTTTEFAYDYTGRRVRKTTTSSGTTRAPFREYEVGPDGLATKYLRIGGELVAAKTSTGTTRFYHADHLGGVHVITDATGVKQQLIEYDPWGQVSRQEGSGEAAFRFTGQRLEAETGLMDYGGRHYDQVLARFLSPDPFVPDAEDPQSLNRYSYVVNNPVIYVDPTGFSFAPITTPTSIFLRPTIDIVDVPLGPVQSVFALAAPSILSSGWLPSPASLQAIGHGLGAGLSLPQAAMSPCIPCLVPAPTGLAHRGAELSQRVMPVTQAGMPVVQAGIARHNSATVHIGGRPLTGMEFVAGLNALDPWDRAAFMEAWCLPCAAVVAPAVAAAATRAAPHAQRLAQQAGLAFQRAHGFVTQNVESALRPGRFVRPDEFNETLGVLSEAKYVQYQAYTQQLKEYVAIARLMGYRFYLHLGAGTRLSQPLQDAVNRGDILIP